MAKGDGSRTSLLSIRTRGYKLTARPVDGAADPSVQIGHGAGVQYDGQHDNQR